MTMVPTRALADTVIGTYDLPTEADVAVCDYLGYDYDTMDPTVKSLLFLSTNGGGSGTETNPNYASYAQFRSTCYSQALSGETIWYTRMDGTMLAFAAAKARNDVAAAVDFVDDSGGSGGGGGDSGAITDGIISSPITLAPIVGMYNNATIVNNVTVNFRNLSQLQSSISNNNLQYVVIIVSSYRYYSNILSVFVCASKSPITVTHVNNGTDASPSYNITVSSTMTLYYSSSNGGTDYTNIIADNRSVSGGGDLEIGQAGGYWSNYVNGGGGDEPVTPPVEQPTNPTGPTVTGPTININTGGNNSSTTTADLTPILEMLRIINGNIEIVNGNITSFSDWFGDAWGDYVDWLQLWFERFGLSLDNIYAQQELVGNNIVDELREIEDVLWYIFYKPDPEYPTNTPYDDTELQGILNGMWADNNGYLNSIQNLLMQISGQIDGLDDVYTPHVGTGKTTQEQLNEDVARLKRKFPFSIPWDLYALLQFLQAPPAAPTFSFTLPYMGTLECDLSVFDDVAAVCRWVSLLWFVAGLLASTNKLLNLMNVFERND